MRLKRPFLKLPIYFDGEALAAEVSALPQSAWSAHPTGFPGNDAVRLITPEGKPTDDIDGSMRPTEHLQSCPYIRVIMGEIGAVWGRSRLMGLAAGNQVPRHVDTNYYWRTHWRIHIPVITNPGVLFTCGDETVHMKAGECWVFDSFRWHEVQNKGSERRIHLVLDTVGGGTLPRLISAAAAGGTKSSLILPGTRTDRPLLFEEINVPKVMSPWEIRCHVAYLAEHASADPLLSTVLERVEEFIESWAGAWARFGTRDEGRGTYVQLLQEVRTDLARLGGSKLTLDNGLQLYSAFDGLIFQMALGQLSRAHAVNSSSLPANRRRSAS